MGLFGVLFDCVLLSSAVAGARRVTGISVADMIVPRIKNDTLRRGVNAYFNAGELVVNKVANMLKDTSPRDTSSIEKGEKRESRDKHD